MNTRLFVLSGGGARGFAHVGVAQALREAGIVPEAISGTSAGAVVGAFLADGFMPLEIRDLFVQQVKLTTMLRLNSLWQGLFSLEQMGEFMRKNLRHQQFEKLPLPLFVTATNFIEGRQHIFSSGDIIPAVLAACSIPVVFPPLLIGDIPYVDGGLSNNLPAEPFCERLSEVVAVYVNPLPAYQPKSSIPAVIDRAWHLSFRPIVQRAADSCGLFLEPPALAAYGLFDAHKLAEIYEHGYTYAQEQLAAAKNAL